MFTFQPHLPRKVYDGILRSPEAPLVFEHLKERRARRRGAGVIQQQQQAGGNAGGGAR